jgi:hypothetical protein
MSRRDYFNALVPETTASSKSIRYCPTMLGTGFAWTPCRIMGTP